MTGFQPHFQSLEDGLDDLERFLLSDDAFWPRGRMPSLSLGEVIWSLSVLRANREQMEPVQRERLETIESGLSATRERWTVAWERKAAAELRTRINLWKAYLHELQERRGEASTYPQEIRNRALAQKLAEQAGSQPEVGVLRESLSSLDSLLRSRFRQGEFVWDPPLESQYPTGEFWFLYGEP